MSYTEDCPLLKQKLVDDISRCEWYYYFIPEDTEEKRTHEKYCNCYRHRHEFGHSKCNDKCDNCGTTPEVSRVQLRNMHQSACMIECSLMYHRRRAHHPNPCTKEIKRWNDCYDIQTVGYKTEHSQVGVTRRCSLYVLRSLIELLAPELTVFVAQATFICDQGIPITEEVRIFSRHFAAYRSLYSTACDWGVSPITHCVCTGQEQYER